jgi:hypothetical protein
MDEELRKEEERRLNEYLNDLDRDERDEDRRLDDQEEAIRNFLIDNGYVPHGPEVMYISDYIESIVKCDIGRFEDKVQHLVEGVLGHQIDDDQLREISQMIRRVIDESQDPYIFTPMTMA